jgi:hypothetical protein
MPELEPHHPIPDIGVSFAEDMQLSDLASTRDTITGCRLSQDGQDHNRDISIGLLGYQQTDPAIYEGTMLNNY